MTAWAVRGVELPFGEEIESWWIDESGSIHDRPVAGADLLPGGFILCGARFRARRTSDQGHGRPRNRVDTYPRRAR